jgi:membrane-associated protein
MSFFDPQHLIEVGGLALIAFIVFAESGLLFGFLFPGDTLLFTAGLIASQGQFSIWAAIPVIVFSAIAGGQVGYIIGQRYGPKLFRKNDSILFHHDHIERAEIFYEKHGGKTIILARFVPFVRTFAPVVAGVGKMNLRLFTIYNVIGSGIWGISVTLLGYYFGPKIPHIDKLLLPIIGCVMVASFGPAIYHILKDPDSRQKLIKKLRRPLSLRSL